MSFTSRNDLVFSLDDWDRNAGHRPDRVDRYQGARLRVGGAVVDTSFHIYLKVHSEVRSNGESLEQRSRMGSEGNVYLRSNLG